jgi:itaconyl-CoA hydratase
MKRQQASGKGQLMFSFYRRVAADRYQERYGLDFEDFAPGQRFRHRPGVTLSQQDNADEALDTLNGAMLHFDAQYAAQTSWQRPLLVSTLTLQRVIGMASKTFARRTAILGFPEIVLNGPLFGHDTLYSSSEVLNCEAGGTVTVRFTGHKPDGAEVARITCRMAIARRDSATSAAAEESRFNAYHQDADGTLVEQCGLFFEDLRAGETFTHAPKRHFLPEEIAVQSRRALDIAQQGPRVPEPLLLGAVTALTTRTFGRVAANLGWKDVEFGRPVMAGDSLEAESLVQETRPSRSRPDEGVVSVTTIARTGDGETVLRFRRTLLVYQRHMAKLYEAAGY